MGCRKGAIMRAKRRGGLCKREGAMLGVGTRFERGGSRSEKVELGCGRDSAFLRSRRRNWG